jgi:hypothetical protein
MKRLVCLAVKKSAARKTILRVPFKWRRINKKVGVNFENKFPIPFFKQEKIEEESSASHNYP